MFAVHFHLLTKNSSEVCCFLFDNLQIHLGITLHLTILNINKLFVYTINVSLASGMMWSFRSFVWMLYILFPFHMRKLSSQCVTQYYYFWLSEVLFLMNSTYCATYCRYLLCNILFSGYFKSGLSFSRSSRLLPCPHFCTLCKESPISW